MHDDDVPQDDPELVAILGANLTAQLTPAARAELKWQATKYPGGVARVLADVQRDPSIRNVAGVLLDRVARGQHADTTAPPAPRSWPAAEPLPPPGERLCPTCRHPVFGAPRSTGPDACPTCGRAGATAANTTRTEA